MEKANEFAFIDRMKVERAELMERLRKANHFLYSEDGIKMDDNDRNCLKKQTNIMDAYLDILNIRIGNAEADKQAKEDLARKKALAENQQKSK